MKMTNKLLLIVSLSGCLTVFSAPVSLQAFQENERIPRSKQRETDDDNAKARAEKERALVEQYRALIREIEERRAKSDRPLGQQEGAVQKAKDQYERLAQRLESLVQKAKALGESGATSETVNEVNEQIRKTRQQMESLRDSVARQSDSRSVDPKRAGKQNQNKDQDPMKAALARVEHLREAARHLNEAGASELAHSALQMADKLSVRIESDYQRRDQQIRKEKVERESRSAAQPRGEQQPGQERRSPKVSAGQSGSATSEDLRALISEVRRLRAEVNEIRARLDGKDR